MHRVGQRRDLDKLIAGQERRRQAFRLAVRQPRIPRKVLPEEDPACRQLAAGKGGNAG